MAIKLTDKTVTEEVFPDDMVFISQGNAVKQVPISKLPSTGGTSALEARVTELAERLEALTARVAALETGGTGGGGAVWE